MKKCFTLIAVVVLCALSAMAQPNYLAGSSKFDGLSSQTPSGSNMTLEQRSTFSVAYKTVKAKQTADDVWFKFVDGEYGWDKQWCWKSQSTANTGESYLADYISNGANILVNVTKDNYYTFVIATTESADSNGFAVQKTSSTPSTFMVERSTPAIGVATTITTTLNQSLLSEEKIYMAYSAAGGSYTNVSMSGSGTTYTAQIPASVNIDGVTVKYVVFTTTVSSLDANADDFDVLSLYQKNGSYTIGAPAPTPTAPQIAAHRAYLNENDFTDFASLYVNSFGGLASEEYEGEYRYKWQRSTDGGSTWKDITGIRKDSINNIRPIKAGVFRCAVSRKSVATGKWISAVSNTITVTNNGGSSKTVSSNLPIVIVRTDVEDFPSGFNPLSSNENLRAFKAKRSVDVKIIWDETSTDDVSKTYTQDDRYDSSRLYYDKKARMNYRGSSSLDKDRKNYAFAVGDDSCTVSGTWTKDKKKMFNLNKTKDKDFILYAAAADGTKMRNQLGLDLSEDATGLWNSHGRYVRLYVNGEDKGVYIFMEKNKKESSRIQVGPDGYAFKYDKTDIIDRFYSNTGARSTFTTSRIGKTNINTYGLTIDQAFEVIYPEWDEEEFTQQQWETKINTLKNKLQELDDAFSTDNYTKIRQILDYDSWADNFILNEFTMNYDGYRISQFFTMPSADSKILASPMWDLELGFGNSSLSNSEYLYKSGAAHEGSFPAPYWWNGSATSYVAGSGLMGDQCFKAKIRQRWQRYVASGGALADENVSALLNSYATSQQTSVSSSLKDWINSRREWLNNQITGSSSSYPNYISGVTMPDKESVNLGSKVTMTATVSGSDSNGYNYAWYFMAVNTSSWTTLTTSGTKDYAINTVSTANVGQYKCVVKSKTCDCISDSVTAKLTVGAVDVIVTADPEEGGYVTGGGSVSIGGNVTIEAIANSGYRFVDWDDGETENPRTFYNVQEPIEYTANFQAIPKYTITFKNHDGSTLETKQVQQGVVPSYTGATPTKSATAQYTYTFTGWSPTIVAATTNATYTAQFSETVNKYTIRFLNEGGAVLQTSEVEYGQTPSYSGATPTKEATAQYTYTFKGWSPEIATVTKAADYTATYSSTVNKYTIRFLNEGGAVLQISEVEYGQTPSYSGATPTKEATAQYTYTFNGWSPVLVTVTKAQDYTATYSSTVNKYTIRFIGDGGVVLQTSEVIYGETPEYTGETPEKPGYNFTGWLPEIATVTEAVDYIAQFEIATAAESIEVTPAIVYTSGLTIYVIAPDAKTVVYKNIVGQTYASGVSEYTVPVPGIWLVVIDGKSVKVSVC